MNLTAKNDAFLCKLFFLFVLIDWVLKLYQNTWLHDFVGVPFYYIGTDFTYWGLILSGIPQILLSSFIGAWAFDIVLTLVIVWNVFSPGRIRNIIWILLYSLWVMITNAAIGSHFHSYNGFIILGICFCFYRSKYFYVSWELGRYYIMYLFFSAALWKILRGVTFESLHLKSLMMQVNTWNAQHESWYAPIYKIFVDHLWLSYGSMLLVIILQFVFVVGFFTKKQDRWLLILFIFFCISDYLVFRHFFFELLVLSLTLLFPVSNRARNGDLNRIVRPD